MERFVPAPTVMTALLLLLAVAVAADVVIFTDGTRMRVQKYEIKNKVVVITTMDGKLRSIPSNYIDLDATERLNGRQRPQPSQKAQQATPAPPPAPKPSARPTPAVAPPATEPAPPLPEPPPARRRTIPKIPASDIPPPVWTNDELGVSLVVPSTAWQVQDMVASFDVAVQLEKKEGEARATLALIRRSMRNYKDFRKVIGEVESSVAAAPGFRFLGSGPLDLGPYTAYELRFIKQVADLPVYHRIVAYYSKDLAYLLSLACPETRLAENQDDFDSLARGLVIKKTRGELTPKGKPKK